MVDMLREIKDRISFRDVATHYGIKFNHSGKALCPFHQEKSPSFHNYGTHGYCFGCGKVADVIELEAHYTGLLPLQAALSLAKRHGVEVPELRSEDKEKIHIRIEAQKLIESYIRYANENILNCNKVIQYMEDRGLNRDDIKRFQIGYVGNESYLRKSLTNDPVKLELAREIGLITERGDYYQKRIIIPILVYGKPVFLTGRAYPHLEPKYLHLRNSEYINKQIAFSENLNKDYCIVTEGVFDAIPLIKAGFPACALLGTSLGKEARDELTVSHTKPYFALDPDEAGRKNSYHLAREFEGYIMNLGMDKDIDEILKEIGTEKFKELLDMSKDEATYYLDSVIEKEPLEISLKEISKLEWETSKEFYLKTLAEKHGVGIRSIRKDLKQIEVSHSKTELSEDHDPRIETFSEDELLEAKELLESKNILEWMLETTNRAGVVGEEINRKALFLASISRLSSDSISIIYKGQSSSGKSFVTNTVLRMVPKEYLQILSFLTPKALVHSKRDLSNSVLFIQEQQGGEHSDYSIRTLLSEGEISISMPIKNPETGNFNTIEKRVKAEGLVSIQTTTKDRIHHENQTRVFDLHSDETEKQTRKVIEAEANMSSCKTENLDAEFKIWRCAQSLLYKYKVKIPFAEKLAEHFPARKTRARRDFKRVLSLISAHCLLYQYQREKVEDNFLIATYADLEGVLPVVDKVLKDSFTELSPVHLEVLKVIGSDKISVEFSVGELHQEVANIVAYKRLQRFVKYFVNEGLLEWNGDSGVKSKYIKSEYPSEVMSSATPFIYKVQKLLENYHNASGHRKMSSHVPKYSPQGNLDTRTNCDIRSCPDKNQ